VTPRAAPLTTERLLWAEGVTRIAGVDEVGRGSLAGPVVAAAVILPPGERIKGARDSKRLTAKQREEIAAEVRARALAISIAAATAREIERWNIRRATILAIRRALERLAVQPERVLVDGLPLPDLVPHTAIVGGDRRCHTIACASIVAKVCRDRLMRRLAARYPDYGWDTNVGYATEAHRIAVETCGLTPHHRRTFFPAQLELPLELCFLDA
jgi:ribonuclease HII